jgi:hypothetical protein
MIFLTNQNLIQQQQTLIIIIILLILIKFLIIPNKQLNKQILLQTNKIKMLTIIMIYYNFLVNQYNKHNKIKIIKVVNQFNK